MMKVYICSKCGWTRVVSRRREVECYKCGNSQMTLSKIDFGVFAAMSAEERENYSKGWLYIHQKKN